MAWSTRELADLAGTTVNTVRHYHAVGLLPIPTRRYNGYKQYRVEHLVELIRLRRLAELGIPLARVHDLDAEGSAALQSVDLELEAGIERLQRARRDVAAILRENAPPETPRGFESVAPQLSRADRALIQILSRLYGPADQSALLDRVVHEAAPARSAFYELPDEASDEVLSRVAAGLSGEGASWRTAEAAPRGARSAFAIAITELYRPVQRDALRRAAALIAS